MRKHPEALCEECELEEMPYVPTQHPDVLDYNLLFVGQGPGWKVERRSRVPFTGPAGNQHKSLLRQAGFTKDQLPHTNIVQCCVGPDDRKPTTDEIRCCLPRLRLEIQALEPELIISLGEPAMKTLTGKTGMQRNRGAVHPLLSIFQYECKVLCCLHPSYVMRQRQWIPIAVGDYNLIHSILAGTTKPMTEFFFISDPTQNQLEAWIRNLDPNRVVACDLETTGLDPRLHEIIGVSFSADADSALSVIFESPSDPRWETVQEFFEGKQPKCWQNGSFDLGFLGNRGITCNNFVYDTRLAQQLLASDLPTNLDFLREQYTEIPPYKPSKAEYARLKSLGRDKVHELAQMDAVTTQQVMQVQKGKLNEAEMGLMQNLLIPLVYVIDGMERRGVKVDVDKLAALYAQAGPAEEALAEPFVELGLNPRSAPQMIQYFGLSDTREDTLERQIKRGHDKADMMQKLLDYRNMQRLASVYLRGVYQRLDENNYIHTHFKIEGTGTGRLASEDPNLLNVPDVMRVIYNPDPGCRFIEADYSQIELWVLAIVANDQLMIDQLCKGIDIHLESCKICFPQVKVKYNDRKRDFVHWQELVAKALVFGTTYGRTAWSVALEFGCTVAQAEVWQNRLLGRYPGLKAYKKMCQDAFNNQGYLTSPFGRRRYLSTVKQGFNHPIQSGAADVTLRALVRTGPAGLDPRISVYDSVLFNVRTKKGIPKPIRECMESPVPELNGFIPKVTYKEGQDWYNLKPIGTYGGKV